MSNIIEASKSAPSALVSVQVSTDADQSNIRVSATKQPASETAKARSRRSGLGSKQSASDVLVGERGSAGGSNTKDVTPEKVGKRPSKQHIVLDLLRQEDGATIDELIDATAWQVHSVRGFLSGTVRKKLKLNLLSDVVGNGVRRYRVAPGEGSDASPGAGQFLSGSPPSQHGVTGGATGEQAS